MVKEVNLHGDPVLEIQEVPYFHFEKREDLLPY